MDNLHDIMSRWSKADLVPIEAELPKESTGSENMRQTEMSEIALDSLYSMTGIQVKKTLTETSTT